MTQIRYLGAALLLLLVTIPWTLHAQAQSSSPVISYQGMIASPDGTPIESKQCAITVTIYADPDGTQPLWHDTYQAPVAKGVFSVSLGSGTPLPSSAALDRPLYLGVAVGGGKEMRPLTQFPS